MAWFLVHMKGDFPQDSEQSKIYLGQKPVVAISGVLQEEKKTKKP